MLPLRPLGGNGEALLARSVLAGTGALLGQARRLRRRRLLRLFGRPLVLAVVCSGPSVHHWYVRWCFLFDVLAGHTIS